MNIFLESLHQENVKSKDLLLKHNLKHLQRHTDNEPHVKDPLKVLGIPFGRASQFVKRFYMEHEHNLDCRYSSRRTENLKLLKSESSMDGLFEKPNNQSESSNDERETSCSSFDAIIMSNCKRKNCLSDLPHPSKLRKKNKEKYEEKVKVLGWDVTSHIQQLHRKQTEYESVGNRKAYPQELPIRSSTFVHVFRKQEDHSTLSPKTGLFNYGDVLKKRNISSFVDLPFGAEAISEENNLNFNPVSEE